jgi:hypothetical protein
VTSRFLGLAKVVVFDAVVGMAMALTFERVSNLITV